MKLWKHSGTLFIGTGIIHNLIGLIMGWQVLVELADSRFINSITNQMDRNAVFWFLFSGFMMMILGHFMQRYSREHNKPVPAFIGNYLLILATLGCLIMPQSGFWLVLPQALIIIIANRKASVSTHTV